MKVILTEKITKLGIQLLIGLVYKSIACVTDMKAQQYIANNSFWVFVKKLKKNKKGETYE